MTTLSESEIQTRLEDLPEWTESSGSIQRTYLFNDFEDSMAFVNRVAELAEAAQHHPDILIRYSKVTLTLSTHDAGGITEKDFDLAKKADQAA
jgi:4a-hydroxytetrahydrobiopterin dehydratase